MNDSLNLKQTPVSTRLTSFLLAVILLMCVYPLPIIAEEKESDSKDVAFVVTEDAGKRSMFDKHYFLSDGTFVAVTYPEAAHYLDNEGNWQDIDMSLTHDNTSGTLTTKNGAYAVIMSDKAKSDRMVTVFNGEDVITWGISALRNGEELTCNSALARKVEPGIKSFSTASERLITDPDAFALPNTASQLLYENVYKNLNIRYTLYQNKIEEDFLITAKSDITSLVINIDKNDLIPIVGKDGSVAFLDEEKNEHFVIGSPYLTDAKYAVCNDVDVSVFEENGAYKVVYTPNKQWMLSTEREYPILFDPAISTRDYIPGMKDTYVVENENPVVNHSNNINLYVNPCETGRRKTVIRITHLPEIESSMPIISAKLTLTAEYAPFSTVTLKASYYDSGIQFNEYSYYLTTLFDDSCTVYNFLTNPNTQVTFDFSNYIYEMYEDEERDLNSNLDYTGDFVISYMNSNDTTYAYPFCSSEYTSVSSRPVFMVTYGYTLPAEIENGTVVSLENVSSGSLMSVLDDNPTNSSNVFQKDVADVTSRQKFKLEKVSSNGSFLLRSMCSDNGNGRVVHIRRVNGNIADGNNVQMHTANDPIAQQWLLVPYAGDIVRLVPLSRMSLSLTAIGWSDGSNTGTSATSSGNICVKTTVSNDSHQLWHLYDEDGAPILCGGLRSPVDSGNYVISNYSIGMYLHRTGNTLDMRRDTMENLGEATCQWKIVNLGDGYCTIHRIDSPRYMLAAKNDDSVGFLYNSSDNIQDKFKWSIMAVDTGESRFTIQNKQTRKYLTASEQNVDSTPVTFETINLIGTDVDNRQLWRMKDVDEYHEIDDGMEFNDIILYIGDTNTITYTQSPGNATWADNCDFEYSIIQDGSILTYNQITGEIYGNRSGQAEVTLTHKMTGLEYTFSVKVYSLSLEMRLFVNPNDGIFGHCWIDMYNLMHDSVTIGRYELPSGSHVTIGKFGNDHEFSGVWYNREYYLYNRDGVFDDNVYIKCEVDVAKIPELTEYINSTYDSYTLLTDSCVHFAVEMWNIVNDDAHDINRGNKNSPAQIKTLLEDYCIAGENEPINVQHNYGYYGPTEQGEEKYHEFLIP